MNQVNFSQGICNDYPQIWPLVTSQPRSGPVGSYTSNSISPSGKVMPSDLAHKFLTHLPDWTTELLKIALQHRN